MRLHGWARVRLPPALLLLAVLAFPQASAASVGGEIVIEGALSLPNGASLISHPVAIFAEDAMSIESIGARASAIRVLLFEDSYISADLVGPRTSLVIGTNRPTWTATNATISIERSRPGWFGIHPDAATLTSSDQAPLRIEAAPRASLGNGDAIPDENDPSRRYYLAEVDEPTLLTAATAWTYEGAGALKAMGPRVTITSRQNTTTIETGDMPDPNNPGRSIQRWVVIEARDLVIEGRAPVQLAASQADADWSGEITLRAARGTLMGPLTSYTAEGAITKLDGDLAAALSPAQGGTRLALAISGDLRSTTMSTRIVAPIPEGSDGRLGFLILVGAVLAGAGAYARVHHKRRQRARTRAPPTLAADDYSRLGEIAADGERYAEALEWVRHARALSPTSRRLALDEAFYTSMTGDAAAALRILQDPLLSTDPDACLFRSRLLMDRGEHDEAAQATIDALELAPVVLLDIETDPQYAGLLARPDVKRAVRAARRKLT